MCRAIYGKNKEHWPHKINFVFELEIQAHAEFYLLSIYWIFFVSWGRSCFFISFKKGD